MKKISFCIALSFFFVFLPSAFAAKVILVTDHWAPFVMKDSEDKGFFSEIVIESFKAVKQEIEIQYHPWKKCEELLLSGSAWGAYPYVMSRERMNRFNFSRIIFHDSHALFFQKKNFPKSFSPQSLEALKNYKIGANSSYWYEPYLNEAKLNVTYKEKIEATFKDLKEGKVELAIGNTIIGWHLLRKLSPRADKEYATAVVPINEDNTLRIMVSKKYPQAEDINKLFTRGLKTILHNGKYQQILKKYKIQENLGITPRE